MLVNPNKEHCSDSLSGVIVKRVSSFERDAGDLQWNKSVFCDEGVVDARSFYQEGNRLLNGWQKLTALVINPVSSGAVPGTAVRIGVAEKTLITQIHACSDWVVTFDKCIGPEHRIALDLSETTTISLFGVQGAGKSYTIGTIAEMVLRQIPKVNQLPSPLAGVIFHYSESMDYAPEFTSMNRPNDKPADVHKFNSPAWLKHIQKSITSLSHVQDTEMAALSPGEAFLWSNKSTDKQIETRPVKIVTRPRVTKHGGATIAALR